MKNLSECENGEIYDWDEIFPASDILIADGKFAFARANDVVVEFNILKNKKLKVEDRYNRED